MKKQLRKSWIRINGRLQSYKIGDRRLDDLTLKPAPSHYGQRIQRTMEDLRPEIRGHKKIRHMKDLVYKEIKEIASRNNVRGSYAGLAAAYTPEIFGVLQEQVAHDFINCQINSSDYWDLLDYQAVINVAYKNYGVDFKLLNVDILEYLVESGQKFQILDLDFMFTLTNENIAKATKAIESSIETPGLVALWHTCGRKITEDEVSKGRRTLLKKISNRFNISEYMQIDYYEGYPMRCDVFALKGKRNERRSAAA
jgi:hypothetical protein